MLLLIFILLICVLAYYRFKFDKEYTMPVLKENKDLSSLQKWAVVTIIIAIILYLLGFMKLAFWVLILLIPFVLYLHFKTYWIAFVKFFKKK